MRQGCKAGSALLYLPMGFQMSITAIGVMAIQVTVNGLGTPVILEKSGIPCEKKLFVDPVLCVGCTMCEQICPRHAIGPKAD